MDGTDPLGGVSTWAFRAVDNLPEVDIRLTGIPSDPSQQPYARAFTSGYRIEDASVLTASHIGESLLIPNYFEWAFQLAATAITQRAKVRCLGICHTDEPHYYRLLSKYEPIVSSFIAVSMACYDRLYSILPRNRRDDIMYLPYGVDTPRSRGNAVSTGRPLRILYAGRIIQRQKRVLDIATLVQALVRLGVDFRLTLAGGGEAMPMLIGALQSQWERVTFAGIVPPGLMADVYEEHDIFILTSETEGLSIAMLEAMSYGLIPVVTNVSGCSQVIDHAHNGFLYAVGDIESAAASIKHLCDDCEVRQTLSSAARATVQRSYRADVHFTRLEAIMRRCWTLRSPRIETAERLCAS